MALAGAATLLPPSGPADGTPAAVSAPDRTVPEAAAPGADTLLPRARALLEDGLSIPASRLLARGLSRGEVAGPDAVLLAARANAAHGAWAGVRRLLLGQPWLDELAGGEGRRLLARARLELGDPEGAAADYVLHRSAYPAGEVPLGARVSHARALSAAGDAAAAATALLEAAGDEADLGGWLRLSALRELVAAAGEEESTGADRLHRTATELAERLTSEPGLPRDSVRAFRALLAFHAGDEGEGIRWAREAGALYPELAGTRVGPALLERGDTAAAREAFRAALAADAPPPTVAPLLLALDESRDALREVAASELRAGRTGRGIALLERALEAVPDSEPGERAELGGRLAEALVRSGRPAEALEVLEPWLAREDLDGERHGSVWLLASRARAAVGGAGPRRAALRRAAEGEGEDAAYAAYLVGDLLQDDGEIGAARQAYEAAVGRFSRSRFGARALVRLGLLDLLEGRPDAAADRFDAYRRHHDDWTDGALYWSGRAREAAGRDGAARTLYRRAVEADPFGWYALLAGRRLGVDPWTAASLPPEGGGGSGGPSAVPSPGPAARALLERMGRLRALGWTGRARAEYAGSRLPASRDPRELLSLALALDSAGWTSEGVRLAWRAHARGAGWSYPLLRALHPLPYRAALEHAAARHGLPPALVAALARRESLFDREVVSVAGAVGLMQLLPATALDVAPSVGLAELGPAQLRHAEVSLLLGTRYLADLLDRFGGSRTAALIGYNAGPHRWLAWRDLPERAFDPEVFVERIPFRETRRYVRAVGALTEVYARLYGLEAGPWRLEADR